MDELLEPTGAQAPAHTLVVDEPRAYYAGAVQGSLLFAYPRIPRGGVIVVLCLFRDRKEAWIFYSQTVGFRNFSEDSKSCEIYMRGEVRRVPCRVVCERDVNVDAGIRVKELVNPQVAELLKHGDARDEAESCLGCN